MFGPLALLLPFALGAKALSTAEIQAVLGNTDLTGASVALPNFLFTLATNATHALVSLNATGTPPSQTGWMATGVGTAMANADFLITWPNTESSTTPWTLSHRNSPSGESQPVIASSSAATSTSTFYTFLPDLSSSASSPFAVVTYLRPLAMPANYPSTSTHTTLSRASTSFIFASCSVSPASTSETATIIQHDHPHTTTTLDLSKPISVVSTGSGSGSSSSNGNSTSSGSGNGSSANSGDGISASSGGTSSRDKMLIAHGKSAVFGSLAFVIFSPLAILIARYFRGHVWFPAHAGFNTLAAVFVIIAFALGYHNNIGPNWHDPHTRLGLALFILVLLQVALGVSSHLTHPNPASSTTRLPTLSSKPAIRYLHIILGISISVLGFCQVRLGFDEWNTKSDGGTSVPNGVVVVFWIIVGVDAALYVGGWVREAMGGNRSAVAKS